MKNGEKVINWKVCRNQGLHVYEDESREVVEYRIQIFAVGECYHY